MSPVRQKIRAAVLSVLAREPGLSASEVAARVDPARYELVRVVLNDLAAAGTVVKAAGRGSHKVTVCRGTRTQTVARPATWWLAKQGKR